MKQIMSSFNSEIGTFLVGIVGSIIASYLYDSLTSKNNQTSPIVMIFQSASQTNYINQRVAHSNFSIRTRNPELLKRGLYQILFFGITFFILWAIVQITIGLLGVSYYHKTSVLIWNTLFICILYAPLVHLCDEMIAHIERRIHILGPLTFEGWLIARTVVFLFLSLLCGGIVSFFLGASLTRAFGIPLFLFVVIILVFFSRDSETKRPRNICWECSNTWFPKGKNVSKRCPRCKTSSVSVDWVFEYRAQIYFIVLLAIFFIFALYVA